MKIKYDAEKLVIEVDSAEASHLHIALSRRVTEILRNPTWREEPGLLDRAVGMFDILSETLTDHHRLKRSQKR